MKAQLKPATLKSVCSSLDWKYYYRMGGGTKTESFLFRGNCQQVGSIFTSNTTSNIAGNTPVKNPK
jgi:hypothetical protein